MSILRHKKNFLGLTASLLLSGALLAPASAQNSPTLVGSVVDIDGPRLYTNRLTTEGWYQGYSGMKTFLSERLRTDNRTQAIIQFLVGGLAGIGKNSQVQIVTPKDVSSTAGSTMRIDAGTFWAKLERQEKQFQIETSGGVIGIEGTELLVGVDEKGVTEVLLFEGQVKVTDDKGNEKTLFPGDYAEFGGAKGMCVLSYPSSSLRTLIVERYPAFSSFLATHNVTSIPTPASPTLVRGFNKARASLVTILEDAKAASGPAPAGLSPSQSTTSGPPRFSWQAVPGASDYALYLTTDGGMEDIVFSSRVEENNFTMPDGARGLEQGRYFWAVVPLDEDGKPLGKAGQTWIETPGWSTPGVELAEEIE